MKRISLLIAVLILTMGTYAQKFEPNTNWPYLYENFTPGVIYFDGNTKSEAELNIHLWGNVLHYVGKEGKIFQSKDKNVIRVEIGDDAYIFMNQKLVNVLAVEGTNVLVKQTRGDFDALRSNGGGAYGSSTNSSATKDLSSLDVDLRGMDQPELGLMLQEKSEGRAIPLVESYYFVISDQQIEATKKGVEKYVGAEKKDALKQFLKDHKIKWKNDESLALLLHFLVDLQNDRVNP